MVASDFRTKAREKLSGKWKNAVLITLAFFGFSIVISYLDRHTTGLLNLAISIFSFVVDVPLIYGLTMAYLKLFKDEEIGAFDLFTFGYENFSRAWSVAWQTFLKLLVPLILLVVSYVFIIGGITYSLNAGLFDYARSAAGATSVHTVSSPSRVILPLLGTILLIASLVWLTIKSYYYVLASLIAIENPEIEGKVAVQASKELMDGKRGKLFCLQISFIGWAILAAFTFGIGYLWLVPYFNFATIAFYKYHSENG